MLPEISAKNSPRNSWRAYFTVMEKRFPITSQALFLSDLEGVIHSRFTLQPPPSINNSTEKVFFYSFLCWIWFFVIILRMPAWWFISWPIRCKFTLQPPPSINNSTEKVFFYSFLCWIWFFVIILRMPAWWFISWPIKCKLNSLVHKKIEIRFGKFLVNLGRLTLQPPPSFLNFRGEEFPELWQNASVFQDEFHKYGKLGK